MSWAEWNVIALLVGAILGAFARDVVERIKARRRNMRVWTHSVHDPIPPNPTPRHVRTQSANSTDHSVVHKVRISKRRR